MKYKPVSQPNIMNLILLLLFILIVFLFTDNYFSYFVLSMIAIGGIISYINQSSNWYQFKSSPKEITEARVVDRRIKSSNHGKGRVSYTYYVTYQFEDIADRRTFTFDEQVSEEVYNWINIGTLLTVEYVIDNPELARRLVGDVKNRSSFKSLSYGVKETPVYPDTPEQKPYPEIPVYPAEQEPYPETPIYPDTAEQEP